MIAGLKPYTEMKNSGLPWLGPIPVSWQVRRAKTLLHRVDVRSNDGTEELLTVSSKLGVVPRRTTNVTMFQAESYAGHKLCWPGDLVINSLWAWGNGLGVAQHHGIVSTAYGVYRARNSAGIVPRYLHELVRSSPFHWELQVRSKGVWISRLQLTDESFLNAPLPLPPVEEQVAIVRFLDHADKRIRRAIATKQKLIRLLEEQKQAIIHRAVTRGLDTDVCLKPSGDEWLGDVPENWEVRRINACLLDARAGIWGSDPISDNGPDHIVCVRVADFDMPSMGVSRKNLTMRAIPEAVRLPRLLESGDILIEKSGGGEAEPVGRVVLFDLLAPAVCSNFVTRLRPDTTVIAPKFLLSVLTSMQSTRRNVPWIKQTTGIQNLNERGYLSLPIGVPPMDEQMSLVAALEADLLSVRSLHDRAQSEIALLREYCTRLIADIVTGKLDVREAVARLPDSPESEFADDEALESESGEDTLPHEAMEEGEAT